MKLYYLLEGCILTMVAADTAFVHGAWAWRLGLPFGRIALIVWLLVPIIFIAVSNPYVRKKIGVFQYLVHILAIICIVFPVVVFGLQSRSIKLLHLPSREISNKLKGIFNGRIIFRSDRGNICAYVPRSFDQNEVFKTIFGLDATLNPADQGNEIRSNYDLK